MTSAWKEPSGQDDRAEGQDAGPDENQLEMFETAPRVGTETLLPPETEVVYGSARPEGVERIHVGVVVTEVSTRDFLDVGGADSDELRRLEDSIRWLMNEGSVRRMPRAATLPSVRGLSPAELQNDDSLLLDPDTLFPPRSSRRRGGLTGGVVKVLLVCAVAAPAAYFIANWMQFPGTAAPSANLTGSFEERIAAVAPVAQRTLAETARAGDDSSSASQPEPMVMRGIPLVETSPDTAADAGGAEPKGAPEQAPTVVATPASPVVAPSAPADRDEVAPSSPPPQPVAAPAKPQLSAQDIAALVERGRILFEAGDLAAARLFFRRAANAGDAAGALAMGATYDPDVLTKRFIRGIEADAQEARMWYERARELGSPEGPRRIEMLAHR
jgi:hypothetical protein